MNDLPRISSLTPDDRIWRLDWFGDCAYPGAVRRYAQPSIKAVLSPLLCDPSDHAALILPDSTNHQQSRETWLPIASLPMVAIGDLWQHGQPITSPDYQVESFKKLSINPDTTAFVKAGLAIDERFLLPLSHHPWHRLHTQSYCVAVTLDAQRRLLVPCMEIIRFYFGSSSNFLQRLFAGPLTPEKLWTSKKFNPANRHLRLVLANRLSGLSSEDIGRIAGSQFAWRAAAGIHASCQKAMALGRPAYPYTGFPFEGATDLVASGVWLPLGDQEKATFLAFRLRSCSHPFPFQSLSYESGDRKAKHAPSGNAGTDSRRTSHSDSKNEKSEVGEMDPGANKSQRRATFSRQRRFTDLIRKSVWRDKIETMPNADVFLRHEDGRLEQVAFGESTWSSTTPGIDVSQADRGNTEGPKDKSLPWFVQTGLKSIRSDPAYQGEEVQIKIICPAGKSEPVFSLPAVIDDDGVIANQLFFTSEEGSTRQRCGCFVEVVSEDSLPQCRLILEGGMRSARPQVRLVDGADLKYAIEIAVALPVS